MWSFFSRDPIKDFPYEIGKLVTDFEGKSFWTLHKAKRKGCSSGEDVSVFIFETEHDVGEHHLDIVRAAIKRIKTLRHPSILTYLDSFETDKMVYLVTEKVEPLHNRLSRKTTLGTDHQKNLYFSWGIFQITRALNFLNNDGYLRHNNVNLWSVFVNEESGEWKLGGVEYMTPMDTMYTPLPPVLQIYCPPEDMESSKSNNCAVDMWGLGCLIWEVFNGPLNSITNLKITKQIPKQLITVYQELTSIHSKERPSPADVIARCRSNGGFFKNDLIDVLLFLEEIHMKERGEKGRFFSLLTNQLDSFPEGVGRYKIFPQLLAAFEFGDAGSAVLSPLLQLGHQLPNPEYQRQVVPCVVKLFASNDRATRLRLLQQLGRFINHLQPATVNEAIFPQIARGFLDTNPIVREQSINSIIHLAPKLDYNNLNVETLRYFARLQSKDEEDGIRMSTIVCLGKVAQHLHPQIRQKVLIGAFIRGIRDQFPLVRSASVLTLAATQQYFLLQEIANRVLPALCPLTMDIDKGVRDNTFRTIHDFLCKLERVSEDPGLRESMEADVHTATPSLSNAAATWAGWAVTAVTAKFYRSQSDTSKSSNSHNTSRILLSKPASLEQAGSSQSSTSTATTSSATNMTSLDHDQDLDTQNNANMNSDCDWSCWEADSWGDMQQQSSTPVAIKTNNMSLSSTSHKVSDQWTSLEEELEEEVTEGMKKENERFEVSWEDSEFQPLESIQSSEQLVAERNNKLDEARRKREERKLARQLQMEAKRGAKYRTNAPPKKNVIM